MNCDENFAGTGNKAYIARLTPEQRASMSYVGISAEDDGSTPIRLVIGKASEIVFQEVVLKSKVNKIDYQSNPNGGGYIATANLVVDKQLDSWAYNSRILNNTSDWIVLLSTGKQGEYYVLGDANFDNDFSDAGTTGDAPDSDKRSTITVTAGPMRAEYLKIDGTLEPSGDGYTLVVGS